MIHRCDKKRVRALGALEARIIEYASPNMPESEPCYRLMTTQLGPAVAAAQELAALYHARWHVESVFDELKTPLRPSRRVLRSKNAGFGAPRVLRVDAGSLCGALANA